MTLYKTGLAFDGTPLLGGMFVMQDSFGFPLDASLHECELRGFKLDFLEALCACWVNDPAKFDSVARQASDLAGRDLEVSFMLAGAAVLARFPKMKTAADPVTASAKYILARKRRQLPFC